MKYRQGQDYIHSQAWRNQATAHLMVLNQVRTGSQVCVQEASALAWRR
jgi:hypothetical protein